MVQTCAWHYIHIYNYLPEETGAAFLNSSAGTPSKDTDFGSNEPRWALLVCDSETRGMQATDQTWATPEAGG